MSIIPMYKLRYKLKKKAQKTYNRGDRASQSRRYREAHRLAYLAQQKVNRAIKAKKIIRPDECSVCGLLTRSIHAHHEDYNKPLEVIWVCWFCHNNLHKKESEVMIIG